MLSDLDFMQIAHCFNLEKGGNYTQFFLQDSAHDADRKKKEKIDQN